MRAVLTSVGECKRYKRIAVGWLFLWMLRMLRRATGSYGDLTIGYSGSWEELLLRKSGVGHTCQTDV